MAEEMTPGVYVREGDTWTEASLDQHNGAIRGKALHFAPL